MVIQRRVFVVFAVVGFLVLFFLTTRCISAATNVVDDDYDDVKVNDGDVCHNCCQGGEEQAQERQEQRRSLKVVDYHQSLTDVLLFPWIMELVGVLMLFVLTRRQLPLPYAACMFIVGAISGAVAVRGDPHTSTFTRSFDTWATMDGSLLLLVFLPGLLFADAIGTDFDLFQLALGQILILAFPMVLVGTLLTGLVAWYVLPYEWTLGQVLTLGAILASTDPIAVSSVLKTAGASPRLVIHISGESLLNDGSSVVFYTLFSHLAFHELGLPGATPVLVRESIWLFAQMSVGGFLVGCAFGAGLILLLYMLDRYLEPEYDILQVVAALCMAYLSYYVCDQFLEMSGVVACVTCGIVAQGYGKGLINDEKLMKTHLELMEHLLNTLLFALGGAIWAENSYGKKMSYRIETVDWGWLGLLYILVLAIRFVQVATFYPVLSRIGLRSNRQEATFLAYGGLRGSVGVALGLSLVRHVDNATDDPTICKLTTILQFMSGGVTLLTLSINGTTAGLVLKTLGLAKPPESRKRALTIFEGLARDYVNEQCQKLLQEPRFEFVDIEVLQKHVPYLSKEPWRSPTPLSIPPSLSSGSATNSTSRFQSLQVQSLSFQKRASTGDRYMRVLSASRRFLNQDEACSDYVSSSREEEQLLIQIRTVFLELLNEAYQVMEELGELAEKEDNGHMLSILQQTANLAMNSVEHDDNHGLDDWHYLNMFRANAREAPLQEESVHGDMQSNRPLRFYRHDVLFPIIFIEGHHLAETKLHSYMNRMDLVDKEGANKIHAAVEQVLKESQQEVGKANNMLEHDIDAVGLEIVLTTYCAQILLRRFMKFVDQKAKEGVLQRSEAREIMTETDSRVHLVISDAISKIKKEIKLNKTKRQSQCSDRQQKRRHSAQWISELSVGGSINEESSLLLSTAT